MDNNFEKNLAQTVYTNSAERTNVDKLTARDELNEIKELVLKENMTLEEVNKLIHLLTSTQAKLWNFDAEGLERNVIGKYFIWLREYAVMTAKLLTFKSKTIKEEMYQLNEEEKLLLDDAIRIQLETLKFQISIFQYMGNTSLSIEGAAFDKLGSSNYRYSYPNQTGIDEAGQGLINKLTRR